MIASLPTLLAKFHPAVVHAPIGAVLFLPWPWVSPSAGRGMAGNRAFPGHPRAPGRRGGRGDRVLLRPGAGGHPRRSLAGPPGPTRTRLPRPPQTHQLLALAGFPFGVLCVALLGWRRPGALRAAFAAALLWLALSGAAGHWGGRMVFKETPAVEAGP